MPRPRTPRIPLAALAALAVAAGPSARADAPAAASAPAQPSPEEIVQRASAQLARKPKKLSCTVEIEAAQLGSDGKPSETQGSVLTETWADGVAAQGLPFQRSADGKPLDAKELAKANEEEADKRASMKEHEQKGEGGNVDPPLAPAQLARHRFALLRKDELAGRPVYLLSVAPASDRLDEHAVTRAGTLTVDAETFLLVRAETRAQPLPKHVDEMQFIEEYALTAQGETAPKSLTVAVKGGFLFFTKRFRVESRWRDCR